MSRQVEHGCDLRWGRVLRLVLVALFVAWGLASVLHTLAFAAPSDGASFVAVQQSHGGSADHDHSGGQTCAAQAHCSGLWLAPTASIAVSEPSAHGLPPSADMAPLAALAPVYRPPIVS
jgi:hypothetical protein